MRTLAKALGVVGALLSIQVNAEDLSGFYTWIDTIVVEATLNEQGDTVVIKVKDEWESDVVPQAYRLWIANYIVCDRFSSELADIVGLKSEVVLADSTKHQSFSASGWTPGGGKIYSFARTYYKAQSG